MNRAIGVRLQYAPADVRRLVIEALRALDRSHRKDASTITARYDASAPGEAQALLDQADLAAQVADELEGA